MEEKKENKFEYKCHYCGSFNIVYRKRYNYNGVWVNNPNLFLSCSNKKCPYYFNLEGKYELIDSEVEFIKLPYFLVYN